MIAVVTTTPARAYTIRHPDGWLVAEVLWGAHGHPVLVVTKPTEVGDDWRSAVVPSWHKARDEAQQWARDEWSLTVPDPDDDLERALDALRDVPCDDANRNVARYCTPEAPCTPCWARGRT